MKIIFWSATDDAFWPGKNGHSEVNWVTEMDS